MPNHLLTITGLEPSELAALVRRSVAHASGETADQRTLTGRVVGIYFRRSSTRTRSSFSVGALRLGADIVTYGPGDLQINTGESIRDTARVLSGYLDGLVVRTNDSDDEMRAFAHQDGMAVINAMSAREHPSQAVADLSTLQEHFGELSGLHVLYVGEGNNSAASLALAVACTPGMRATVASPAGYDLPQDLRRQAAELAEKNGARIDFVVGAEELPSGVDAVYATRWRTMGMEREDPGWLDDFAPFAVDGALMERVSKPDGGTVFLHDLPAMRGEDVTDEVLDGPQSIAFRQAEHKMFAAMAVLEWAIVGLPGD
jgi:ornithine carbamoyltransferase